MFLQTLKVNAKLHSLQRVKSFSKYLTPIEQIFDSLYVEILWYDSVCIKCILEDILTVLSFYDIQVLLCAHRALALLIIALNVLNPIALSKTFGHTECTVKQKSFEIVKLCVLNWMNILKAKKKSFVAVNTDIVSYVTGFPKNSFSLGILYQGVKQFGSRSGLFVLLGLSSGFKLFTKWYQQLRIKPSTCPTKWGYILFRYISVDPD